MKRILGIAVVLGLGGALTFIVGCSKEKAPQIKAESDSEKFETASNERGITEEPTKKESSGKEKVIDLGKDVKLEMVLIPAGKFMMGSPASEKGRLNSETQHEVTLTKHYYMGKYEVTQEQWETVIGSNPSSTKGDKLPVTNVSWIDCQEFINKLNAKTSGDFRLPTEAEWEYACRAGTSTAFSFGDSLTKNDANINGLRIKKVGSYKPNAFGLYDMHGNVFEWCNDWYGPLQNRDATDPKGAETGKNGVFGDRRVLRGGSSRNNITFARSSYRDPNFSPSLRLEFDGFRLAKTP